MTSNFIVAVLCLALTAPPLLAGERSERQRTADLSALIQEVIALPDWQAGNALVFIISGSGERDAESYDGDPTAAPRLYVEYGAEGG